MSLLKNMRDKFDDFSGVKEDDSALEKAKKRALGGARAYAGAVIGSAVLGTAAVADIAINKSSAEDTADKFMRGVQDIMKGKDTVNGMNHFSARAAHLRNDRLGNTVWMNGNEILATKKLEQDTDEFVAQCVARFGDC